MSDFSTWEDLKEYLHSPNDPWLPSVKLEDGHGVPLYWTEWYASCGDDECCYQEFDSIEDVIDQIKHMSINNIDWVKKYTY